MSSTRILRRLAGSLLAGWLLFTGPASMAQSSQRDVLREITDVVGLKPRFELRATSDVENAAAVVYGGKRYLLYNPTFVAAVNRAGRTDWAGISILAHEMGHHLNGHTLRAGGSNPSDELEADEFSGFVLRKMGASLAESQTAMAVVAQETDSPTHPGRTTRLAAIGRGWQQANGQIVASARTSAPSSAPVAVAQRPVVQPGRPTTPVVQASSAPVSVVGKLTFHNSPQDMLFVTNRLSVVRFDPADHTTEVVGRLTRSTSADFPFVLVDAQQRRLFVSAQGGIYNTQGQQIGRMSDPS
ncbi:membrane-binding protein [Hymenobacter busanensis]|uniref:Membrane-binding protein n=1 Tax=Hymenobacter busanensis TaxID=2607656 RepID=A0A7L4ZSN2_9BACT|nr:membrane-binding protein [Hymenobacter busanensis]KAA9327554.1 membrane-binding protein [Hymenobacter busanensis]QHJ06108.1 membrane-binding protein [Hymenobacter busanensis]